MDKEGFDPDSRLRASDADRDSAAAVINGAMAEGRLTAAEHSERLDAIYTARTHAELAPILDDLPARAATGVTAAGVTAAGPPQAPARQRGGRIAAVLSSASRSDRWRPEPSTAVVTVFGSADLDFREAVLPGREIALRAVAVLGSVSVIVPPEMRVVDSGLAIMGTRDIAADGAESERPDAPVLRLSGCPCWAAWTSSASRGMSSRIGRRRSTSNWSPPGWLRNDGMLNCPRNSSHPGEFVVLVMEG